MPESSAENENALKHLFGKALLGRIAASVGRAYPAFDRKSFLALRAPLEKLEMKPRVHLLRDALRARLPEDYRAALDILLASADDGTLEGFDLWPYTEFIAAYGLDAPALSLAALARLTPRFTAEWAVRPFIKRHPAGTLKYLLRCAGDKDVHLRRWASEGTRPRLPWGERLQDFIRDPAPALPILEKLKFDAELYVRKSVANHLNDIAKDHPAVALKTLGNWRRQAGAEHAAKIDWITRRALRTLIKAGDRRALKLIGAARDAKVGVSGFTIARRKISLGQSLDFEFGLRSLSDKPQKLVVDYIVHFVKARQGTAPKVFKLRTLHLPAGGALRIGKSHAVKKITTRDYYPGRHFLEIQINGVIVARQHWDLEV